MAGLGYKDFTAGAVLTAAQVDGYLMEQAVMNFAGTAARGSALASVQAAGMVAHVGGGTLTVATSGSAWAQVYPSTASAGLDFITSATLSGASVTISSCFSATYNVYEIVIDRLYNSASTELNFRLRTGSTDATTNYQIQEATASGTSWNVVRTLSLGQINVATMTTTEGSTPTVVKVFNPFAALATNFLCTTGWYLAQNTPGIYINYG